MQAEQAAAAFDGERLRLARHLRGMTLRDLSAAAGVTAGGLSQMESGRIGPTPATAARLALALQLPLLFFTMGRRDLSGAGANGVHFRSLRSSTLRERQSAWAWSEMVLDIAAALEAWVDLPAAAVPTFPLAPDAGPAELREATNTLRREWQLPDGPIGNLLRNLEVHGTVTAWSGPYSPRIDAFSQNQSRRPVVVLGPERGSDAARLRFSTAHELGHLVCHPDPDPSGAHEAQAHAFAAELLMPAHLIADELPRRFDLGRYARLKARWGVSIQALLYRAKTLAVISDGAYRRAMIVLGQTYGRTYEPFPLPTVERPQLLSRAYQLALASGATPEAVAEFSGLPLETVMDVVNPPARASVEL